MERMTEHLNKQERTEQVEQKALLFYNDLYFFIDEIYCYNKKAKKCSFLFSKIKKGEIEKIVENKKSPK